MGHACLQRKVAAAGARRRARLRRVQAVNFCVQLPVAVVDKAPKPARLVPAAVGAHGRAAAARHAQLGAVDAGTVTSPVPYSHARDGLHLMPWQYLFKKKDDVAHVRMNVIIQVLH